MDKEKVVTHMGIMVGLQQVFQGYHPDQSKQILDELPQWAEEFMSLPKDEEDTEREVLSDAEEFARRKIYEVIGYKESENYIDIDGIIQVPPGIDGEKFFDEFIHWLTYRDASFSGGAKFLTEEELNAEDEESTDV